MSKIVVPLKYILLIFGSVTTIGIMLMIAYSVQRISSDAITKQIGQTMAVLADQVQDKIDLILLERYQDISIIAALVGASARIEPESTQLSLERSLASHPQFAWLGLFTTALVPIASAGDSKLSNRILSADWLHANVTEQSSQKSWIGVLPPIGDSEHGTGVTPSFGLAAPVRDPMGKIVGIAVAVSGWDWAQSITSAIARDSLGFEKADAFILSSNGRTILAPPNHVENFASTQSYIRARSEAGGSIVEAGADGKHFVTGYSKARIERFFREPGLIVLIRQDAAIALQPLTAFNHSIILIVALFAAQAVALNWALTARITAPLLQIASAASELKSTGDAQIPRLTQFAEVQMLSEGLISLVEDLKGRQAALMALSASLEAKVVERTNALEERNQLLTVATKRAEQATEAKSRLLASASHDLRQPLHALNLFCLALKRRTTTAEAAQLVIQIERSLSSLKTMLDKLLHIARLDSGLVVSTISAVSVREFVERIGAEFTIEADQRALKFNFTSVDCLVETDLALLETIVRNLLSNAFKFTSTGGILFAARSRGPHVVIEIYDTGPGIEASRLGSIFREFDRSAEQAVGPNEGLGLGLSIVERQAQLIGAQIAVHSIVGKGSRFSVIVAKAEGAIAPVVVEQIVSSEQPVRDLDVLLLDDNGRALRALTQDLEDRGARVTGFQRVETALAALRSGLAVDVAVVDFDLADMTNGLEFLDICRQEGWQFGAMILTGRTDGTSLGTISRSGVLWQTKPADPAALAAAIGRLANSSSSTCVHTEYKN